MVLREVVEDGFHLPSEFGRLALVLSLLFGLATVLHSLRHGVLLRFADDVKDESEIEGVVMAVVLELAGVQPYLGEGFLCEGFGSGFEVLDAGFA